MTLIGMDPGQVRELAGALSRSSGALREIRQQVSGELASAGWDGVDAAQFREQWTRCSTDLMAAAEGLDSAQKVLLKQADEQERASEAGDAGGAGNEGHVGTGQTMLQASGAGGAGAPGLPATGGNKAPMGPPDGREPLDQVLKKNQVKEDEMVDWEPGFPFNMLTDPRKVTASEAVMLDKLAPWQQNDFKNIHDQAFEEADREFPSTPEAKQNDDHNDAYRHALWSAKLAQRFGPDWAEEYTTAHERNPENPAVREAMDLHNNGVGIKIVRDNPNASEEEIAQKVKEAVERGDTVVVDKQGNLQWSDRVPQGETGHPSEERLPGRDPGEPDKAAES